MTTANHYLPSGRNIQKRPAKKPGASIRAMGSTFRSAPCKRPRCKRTRKSFSVGLKNDERPARARLTPKMIEETTPIRNWPARWNHGGPVDRRRVH